MPKQLLPLGRRGPLRALFVITSMPVGGAEVLLVNLVRRLDRARLLPEVCCLKKPGPLGEMLAKEMPVHSGLLASKWDVRVLPRLVRLLRAGKVDAVVTVGAGDKMFWGRLAGRLAGVPVVISALHSTGWPDSIGRLNRLLTPITDAFIAVAPSHGRFLIDREGLPRRKVAVVPNGVDVERFARLPGGDALRAALDVSPAAPLVGIVAALRPEKNHALFLRAAQAVLRRVPEARFLIVGDGPERVRLETLSRALELEHAVRFVGTRDDVPALLSLLDVFVLSSRNEANPVSILEAMAAGKPVVATDVGSVADTVRHGVTGYLVSAGDVEPMAGHVVELLQDPLWARQMGANARRTVVTHWSLERMVEGYQQLIEAIYTSKCAQTQQASTTADSPAQTEASDCR